jgi:hypothetical protein
MAIFAFEFRDGDTRELVDGIQLDDVLAARREAWRCAREILAEGALDGIDRTDWVCSVIDEQGRVIEVVSFGSLIHKGAPLE